MREKESLYKWIKKYPYPRRRFIRTILRSGIAVAAGIITKYEVSGQENLPKKGPFMIVGNHFHFLDTIGTIHATTYPLEFIGDIEMPNAPPLMRIFPRAWSTLKIEQGTPNFEAMNAAEAVLAQDGILVIYPEGHVHKPPLGKALPGAAYLALRMGVPIIPTATYSDYDYDLFGSITKRRKRLRIWTKVGKPFGPFKLENPARPNRKEIRESSHVIMSHIAQLLPPEFRGEYDQAPEAVS